MTEPEDSGASDKQLGFLAILRAVLMTPTSFFAQVAEGKLSMTPVGFAIFVGGLSSSAAELGDALITGGPPLAALFRGVVRGAVLGLFGTYIIAAVIHLLLRLVFRSREAFGRTLDSVGFGSAGLVASAVPLVGPFVAIVWRAALTVIGIRVTHRVNVAAAVTVVVVAAASPVILALGLRAFVVEAYKTPSASMAPTLWPGEHIFVNKAPYGPLGSGTPARGDVAVFPFPENPAQDFIKRVIGLPGDNVEVVDGRPVINGFVVPQCRVGTIDVSGKEMTVFVEHLGERSYLTMFEAGAEPRSQGPYQVAAGEALVLGDNRHNSHDSRQWNGGKGGGVPIASFRGRASVWFASFAPGGDIFDRAWEDIHGPPVLPASYQRKLGAEIEACMQARPPVAETTPPAPG